MNKYFLLFILPFIGFSSCKKSTFNTAKQAATDDALIQTYISNNGITATKDSSRLYYEIINAGTGASPTVSSTVNVTYTGSLIGGSVFAPTSTLTSPLNTLIQGWQIGIPHIKTGGTILLLIPSALGYGNSSPGTGIPPDAVLVFTITLTSFTN
jgi:FKBP-type peptidyl-prolyl cis-trans isomerase FkpA